MLLEHVVPLRRAFFSLASAKQSNAGGLHCTIPLTAIEWDAEHFTCSVNTCEPTSIARVVSINHQFQPVRRP